MWCYLQPAALKQADRGHILKNGVLPPAPRRYQDWCQRRGREDAILQYVAVVGLSQGRWLKVAPHRAHWHIAARGENVDPCSLPFVWCCVFGLFFSPDSSLPFCNFKNGF